MSDTLHPVLPVLTRRKEHLSTDKNSHVHKHRNGSPSCKRKCSVDCFKIVDSAKTRYCLELKEAIYISRLKIELNAQLQHNNDYCFLCLDSVSNTRAYTLAVRGAVASWWVRSSPDQAVLGSSPGRGHCFFLGKTLNPYSAPLQPGV